MLDAAELAVIETLTVREWVATITADDEGPLPVCCGNVSTLRDALADLLRSFNRISAISTARALEADQGEHFDATGPLGRLLSHRHHSQRLLDVSPVRRYCAQQRLYLVPDPHGHGSLRPTFDDAEIGPLSQPM